MATNNGAAEPGPPPVLFAILDAARALPTDRRCGPFHGLGGSDDRGEDGLSLSVGEHELFVTDEEVGSLIAGDYIDVSAVGAGDGIVHILPRALDVYRDQGG